MNAHKNVELLKETKHKTSKISQHHEKKPWDRILARSPGIETHLAVVRGIPIKKFLPKCVNEKSLTERRI